MDQLLLGLSAAALGCATVFQSSIPHFAILRVANEWLRQLAWFFHDHEAFFNSPHVPIMLALLFFNGIVRSVNQPVKQAIIPQLVPPEAFFNAVGWNTTVVETSNIVGPAVAGMLLALMQGKYPDSPAPYALVYFLAAFGQLGQWFFLLPVKVASNGRAREPFTLRSMFAGVRFVWSTQVILGAITLDLFSVLFGGATALLPMFAKDILHCGPAGLGWLRAAPAIGACTVAVALAHMPPLRNAGRTLLLAVTGFGVATIGFGLSQNFALSLACLFFVGVCDNTSVIIRQTLVQVLTPDSMRGRVSGVKSLFSSASNGLGALESGLTAALFGPVISVVSGGVGAVLVVATVTAIWPQIRKYGALHTVEPSEKSGNAASQDKLIRLPVRNKIGSGACEYTTTSPLPQNRGY